MNTHKKERAPIYPPREYKVRRRYRQTNKILAGFYIDCQDNKSAEFITPEGRVYSPKALQQLIKECLPKPAPNKARQCGAQGLIGLGHNLALDKIQTNLKKKGLL